MGNRSLGTISQVKQSGQRQCGGSGKVSGGAVDWQAGHFHGFSSEPGLAGGKDFAGEPETQNAACIRPPVNPDEELS